VVTTSGLGILVTYGKFVVEFYFSLGLLWILISFAAWVILRERVFTLLRMIREPLLLSFTTASSEAAYPKTSSSSSASARREDRQLRAAARLFVQPRRLDDVLHLSRCSLSPRPTTSSSRCCSRSRLLLILMVTSKGMAGVPRASLVVIAATLATFNIPEAGLLLIMGSTSSSTWGARRPTSSATGVATAWWRSGEGELGAGEAPSRPRRGAAAAAA